MFALGTVFIIINSTLDILITFTTDIEGSQILNRESVSNLPMIKVRAIAHTRTRASAAHSVRSAWLDLVPAVPAM